MSGDDDIAERILEGTTYERAAVTVQRTFPFSIRRKIQLTAVVLAVSTLLAPTLYLSRGRIRSVEGGQGVVEVFGLRIAALALLGVVTATGAGVVLVRQRAVMRQDSPGDERARRLVRIEDFLMWFVLQGGAFVLIPVVLAVVGVVSPGVVDALYRNDVPIYQASGLPGVDARAVSGVGGTFAVVLYVLSWKRG